MPAQLIDLPAPAPEPDGPLLVRVQQCLGGKWTVEIPARWTGGTFVGLPEALAFARRECVAAPATIELRVDDMVCVVHQDRGWPKRICAGAETGAPAEAIGKRLRSLVPSWARPARGQA